MAKYKVAKISQPKIVTEIKRPDPEAVLILRSGETVELSDAEIHLLLKSEPPLIPAGLLKLVHEKEKAHVPPADVPPAK